MAEIRIHPSRDQFHILKDFQRVPVAVSQKISLPPVWPLSLWEESTPYFLISESLREQGPYSLYSYVAVPEKPNVYFTGEDIGSSYQTTLYELSSIENLSHCMNPKVEGLPPFQGGYWCLLSYELTPLLEPYIKRKIKLSTFPALILLEINQFLAYAHKDQRLFLVDAKDPGPSFPLKERYDQRIKVLLSRLNLIKKFLTKEAKIGKHKNKMEYEPLTRREDFLSKVEYIRDLIKGGECIQVVLSQRFRILSSHRPIEVYMRLRAQDPTPYCTFSKFNDFYLIAASPEMLVRHEKGLVISRPIAGTRPRSGHTFEDLFHGESLLKDPKELSEHMMLVDLARNDLGRICVPGTVKLSRLAGIEQYHKVVHIVSEVTGKALSNTGPLDLIRATFPAGTVTGAPKIRAMEIIEEVEELPRGPYAGAFGFISYDGLLDLGITIRSAFGSKEEMYVQAGAGIVIDSIPANEYQETLSKARSLFKAFQGGEDGVCPQK